MPHMYSTIDGRLTPTAPTYEDMKTETPLNVTPEESLEGLSAAVGGIEDERAISTTFKSCRWNGNKCCTSNLQRN